MHQTRIHHNKSPESIEFPVDTMESRHQSRTYGSKPSARLGLYLKTGHNEYRLSRGAVGGRVNFPGRVGGRG